MSESTEPLSTEDAVAFAVRQAMSQMVADGWIPPDVGTRLTERAGRAEAAIRLVRATAGAWTADPAREYFGNHLIKMLDRAATVDIPR